MLMMYTSSHPHNIPIESQCWRYFPPPDKKGQCTNCTSQYCNECPKAADQCEHCWFPTNPNHAHPFYFVDKNGNCSFCPEECGTNCNADFTCKKCNLGYFLNDSNICSKCPPGCSQCNAKGECSECGRYGGYSLNDKKECIANSPSPGSVRPVVLLSFSCCWLKIMYGDINIVILLYCSARMAIGLLATAIKHHALHVIQIANNVAMKTMDLVQ